MFNMTNPADKYEFTGVERAMLNEGVDPLAVRSMLETKGTVLESLPHDTPSLALATLCNQLLMCEIDIYLAECDMALAHN